MPAPTPGPVPPKDGAAPTGADAASTETSATPRRQPGEPHPYMLQRNPPNLWILVAITIFSLVLTVIVMALTIWL